MFCEMLGCTFRENWCTVTSELKISVGFPDRGIPRYLICQAQTGLLFNNITSHSRAIDCSFQPITCRNQKSEVI
jgi:hypothetical protein